MYVCACVVHLLKERYPGLTGPHWLGDRWLQLLTSTPPVCQQLVAILHNTLNERLFDITLMVVELVLGYDADCSLACGALVQLLLDSLALDQVGRHGGPAMGSCNALTGHAACRCSWDTGRCVANVSLHYMSHAIHRLV